MPGKYSHLKGQLTKFTGEPDYQEKVNKKKDQIKDEITSQGEKINLKSLGQVLVAARLEKERLEELVKEQNLIIAAMDQELVDMMESLDFNSVKLETGVSLSIKDDVYCNVQDKTSFHQWIKENNLEDLFTVHYQTMSSMVKEALTSGKPIPPGIGTYFKQSIMVRGA